MVYIYLVLNIIYLLTSNQKKEKVPLINKLTDQWPSSIHQTHIGAY